MNCLLYARVSTDKQAQKDLSIPAQIAAMREYARRNNWHVIGHFVDEGESAKTADRPELKRLIQHCKEEKSVDIVLVHKIDRLARNLIDFATIKAILKQKGIRLVSVSEPFDDNSIGHLLENIIASISEWYSANLGEEVKKANLTKLKRGEWPHKPPLGYRSVKVLNGRVKHIPDRKTAPLIRQIFELFSTGKYSLRLLAEEMYDRGLKTAYGQMYSPESIKALLTRRFYIGRLEWQGKEYKGKHKPLVAPALFYRAQEVLKNRSIDTGEKGKREFLLRGVVYCRACGQRLTGEVHPRGRYYRCIPHFSRGKCDQPYIPAKLLDSQLEVLYERLQPPRKLLELLKEEMHEIAQRRKEVVSKEISGLKKAIEDLETKRIGLLDEMLTGKVARDIYVKVDKKYSEEKKQAEARLSQIEVDYDDPLDFMDKCIVVASMLSYLHKKLTYEQRKNLLRAVFDRVWVQSKAIVNVKLNPPFSFLLGDHIEKLFKNRPLTAA